MRQKQLGMMLHYLNAFNFTAGLVLDYVLLDLWQKKKMDFATFIDALVSIVIVTSCAIYQSMYGDDHQNYGLCRALRDPANRVRQRTG